MILAAAGYRDYVEKHIDKIIDDAFLAFNSANVLTHIPNNKGKAILGRGTVSDNIVRKHKVLDIANGQQSVDVDVLEVESFRAQFHEKYVPELMEDSYYGYLRTAGQNPEDFPFEAYVLMLLAKSIRQWHERQLWQSVKNDATDNGTDLFDGLLKQVSDAVAANDVTPISFGTPYRRKNQTDVAPAGFTAMVELTEELYTNGIPDAWKDAGGVNIYMSRRNKRLYNQDYRNAYGIDPVVSKQYNIERTTIDLSEGEDAVNIIGVSGMGASNRIIMTPQANAVYTYDVQPDMTTFRMQYILNVLHIFGAFRVGAEFLIKNDDWMAVNELV